MTAGPSRVAVIGGGVTGLALAWFLAQAGRQVSLFEARPVLGGNCAPLDLDGRPVDRFYHVLSAAQGSAFREVLAELGLLDRLYRVRTTLAFSQAGRLHPANRLLELALFPPLSAGERLRLAGCFLRSRRFKDWLALDSRSAVEWLTELGGRSLFEKFWRPIMAHKFGPRLEELAATDMWFRLNRMWAVAAGRGSSGPYCLRGALGVLFETWAARLARLGVIIRTGAPVEALALDNGRVAGVVVGGETWTGFDAVAATIPLPRLAALLPPEAESYRRELGRIKYLHNLCLILKTRSPLSPYYQTALADPDAPFTGVISGEQLYPPAEYGGFISHVSRYLPAEEGLPQVSAEELLARYRPFLKRLKPDFTAGDVLALRLVAERDVEAVHVIGYHRLRPAQASPLPGLVVLCQAQIYPEPTIVDVSVDYARRLAQEMAGGEGEGR